LAVTIANNADRKTGIAVKSRCSCSFDENHCHAIGKTLSAARTAIATAAFRRSSLSSEKPFSQA